MIYSIEIPLCVFVSIYVHIYIYPPSSFFLQLEQGYTLLRGVRSIEPIKVNKG